MQQNSGFLRVPTVLCLADSENRNPALHLNCQLWLVTLIVYHSITDFIFIARLPQIRKLRQQGVRKSPWQSEGLALGFPVISRGLWTSLVGSWLTTQGLTMMTQQAKALGPAGMMGTSLSALNAYIIFKFLKLALILFCIRKKIKV